MRLFCAIAQLLWYSVIVKNITVSISDDIYRAARVRAAESGTSVSALVSRFLASLTGFDAEFTRRESLQAEVLAEIQRFSGADTAGRDEIHRRAVR